MLDASGWSRAAWTQALLLQLLLAGPGACLSRQELFPFGPEQGDLELEAGDDVVSPSLELIGELSFYDRSDITSVYVSWGRVGRKARIRWGGTSPERQMWDLGVALGDTSASCSGAGRSAESVRLGDPHCLSVAVTQEHA